MRRYTSHANYNRLASRSSQPLTVASLIDRDHRLQVTTSFVDTNFFTSSDYILRELDRERGAPGPRRTLSGRYVRAILGPSVDLGQWLGILACWRSALSLRRRGSSARQLASSWRR